MQVLASWIIALSVATFAAYGWDKAQAKRERQRIPEKRLHGLALAGGFVGGWLGMVVFRHKTRKPIFKVVLAIGTVAWLTIVMWVLT